MNSQDARYHIERTRRKFILVRAANLLLGSLALVFSVLCALSITGAKGLWLPVISVAAGLIYFLFRAVNQNIFGLTRSGVASYLNRRYPSMEEAADLILREDEDLTSLQQLQKNRSAQHLLSLYPSIKTPVRFGRAFLLFAVSILGYILINSLALSPSPTHPEPDKDISQVTDGTPAHMKNVKIRITPPSYTKIASTEGSGLNLRAPEGSIIQWDLEFDGQVFDPRLIFSGKDSLRFTPSNNNRFTIHRTATTSSFYNIAWRDKDGANKASDFYQVEVIKDQPPVISVTNLNQFTEFTLSDKLTVGVRPTLTDDYSLTDGYIIATVSKGSGESVKFRELKMPFDRNVTGQTVKPSLTLDILKLGLEPGDELYFYVEAIDNKEPVANRTRTETFFIALRDTSSVTTSVDAGLGVDLMPEYFRSQRQIIIDSEKLLKDKNSISRETFNGRSNSLAYDQKVLRLRYGEFLGEEFESGIGQQSVTPDDHVEEVDISKKYGHVHDKDNEHNLVEEKKSPTEHAHDHTDGDKSDPVKEFTHSHDSQEEATFFTQSIRAKLKAAITIMWDAELHLRLYDPAKSLPYQYRALKLLKEISQESRIYVHRTGFEPRPIKEEKRLTGDLSEIKSPTALNQRIQNEIYPDIRTALQQIESLLSSDSIVLTAEARSQFERAGQELASVAIQQPGRFLNTLTSLKALSQNELDGAAVRSSLIEIRRTLWTLLPLQTPSPHTRSRTPHELDRKFLENLEDLKNE